MRLSPLILLSFLIIFCQNLHAAKVQLVDDMTLFQFSRIVAEELDYSIIFSPRVRKNNKVGLVISEAIELDVLYNVFLSVLNAQGYTAVKNDKLIRVVQEYKARALPSGL